MTKDVQRARSWARDGTNPLQGYADPISACGILLKTCLYTLTPDRDFVIDSLPEARNVHVAIGAGHAFKFASVIGRILSDLTLGGKTSSEISGFGLQPSLLQMADPPRAYMI